MIFGIEKMVLGVNFWNLISMSLVVVSAVGAGYYIYFFLAYFVVVAAVACTPM